MTVAALGSAGRVAAAGGARGAAGRAAGSRTIDGRVTSITDAKPARSSGAGDTAKGVAAGQLASDLLGARRGRARSGPGSPARRILVAEFAACMVVLAFSPLVDKHRGENGAAFMKRASAIMILFFVLGLVSTAGRGASRAAAGFGALVMLALLISSRSMFAVIAKKVGTGAGELGDVEGDPMDQAGEAIGRAAGEAITDALGGHAEMGPAQ